MGESGCGLGSIAEALGQDAEFGLGKRELEPIELFVQKADFVTVSDPERVEVRPRPGHFVTAIAELTFELDQLRVQILELVFGMRSRRYQRAHTQNDIECWFRAIILDDMLDSTLHGSVDFLGLALVL